jgi:hypothetical protein
VALGIYDRAKHAVFLKFLSTDHPCVADSRLLFDGQEWGKTEDRLACRPLSSLQSFRMPLNREIGKRTFFRYGLEEVSNSLSIKAIESIHLIWQEQEGVKTPD